MSSQPSCRREVSKEWLRGLGALAGALLLGAAVPTLGCGASSGHEHPSGCPDEHDHFVDGGIVRATEGGAFTVTLHSEQAPLRKGVTSLQVQVEQPDGSPVEGAELTLDATMPHHGHGLGARPVVEEQGGGRYLVRNVYFQMAGYWVVRVHVRTPQARDEARFELCVLEASEGGGSTDAAPSDE